MILHKQPPFLNVALSSTASITNMHLGDTVWGLLLLMGGTFVKSDIDAIRVKLGGKTIFDATGPQVESINDYYGRVSPATVIQLWFADPNALTLAGKELGAIDTRLGYSSFSIEVDIDATAVAPTLACWAIKGPPKGGDARAMFKAHLKATQSIAASGVHSLQPALGSNAGTLLKCLHSFHANITAMDVKKQGLDLQNGAPTLALIQTAQNALNRVSQAGHLAYDPCAVDNLQARSIARLNPETGQPFALEFLATLSAADTVQMISEVYTSIERV